MTLALTSHRTAGDASVVLGARVATNLDSSRPRTMPAFIPAGQAYYWSREWQETETAAMADLRSGNYKSFDDPLDAVRHLLSGD